MLIIKYKKADTALGRTHPQVKVFHPLPRAREDPSLLEVSTTMPFKVIYHLSPVLPARSLQCLPAHGRGGNALKNTDEQILCRAWWHSLVFFSFSTRREPGSVRLLTAATGVFSQEKNHQFVLH